MPVIHGYGNAEHFGKPIPLITESSSPEESDEAIAIIDEYLDIGSLISAKLKLAGFGSSPIIQALDKRLEYMSRYKSLIWIFRSGNLIENFIEYSAPPGKGPQLEMPFEKTAQQ